MATTKNELFDDKLQENALIFKALAHPARLSILKYLAEIKTCITGDITDEIPLSRTTVNQHLKALKKAELIKGSISGVKTNYCINQNKINCLRKNLVEFVDSIYSEESYCKS